MVVAVTLFRWEGGSQVVNWFSLPPPPGPARRCWALIVGGYTSLCVPLYDWQHRVKIRDYTMQAAQGQNPGLYHAGSTGSKSWTIPCRQHRVKIRDYTMQTAQGQNHGLYHADSTGSKSWTIPCREHRDKFQECPCSTRSKVRTAQQRRVKIQDYPGSTGSKSRTAQAAQGKSCWESTNLEKVDVI